MTSSTKFEPHNLPKSIKPLFDRVIAMARKPALDENKSSESYCSAFISWCRHVPDTDTKPLKDLIGSKTDWQALSKVSSEGASRVDQRIVSAFCASAEILDIALDRHLAGFLNNWLKKHKEFNLPPSFSEFEHILNPLLVRYGYRPPNTSLFHNKINALLERSIYERKEIIDEIKKFLNNNSRGFMTIEGGPGMGKSCIAATMAKQDFNPKEWVYAWRFNQNSSTGRSVSLIESVYEQLKVPYDISIFEQRYREQVKYGKGYETFLNDLFNHLATSRQLEKKLFLIVDALDEVDNDDPSRRGIGNVLFIPTDLPEHVYCLLTSRNFDKQRFNEPKHAGIILDKGAPQHEKDIEGYVREKVKTDKGIKEWIKKQELQDKKQLTEEHFIETVIECSQYSFIYLYYIFMDIEELTSLRDIPLGIKAYYEEQFIRLLGQVPQQHTRETKKIFDAILQFPPNISVKNITRYCRLDSDDVEELCEYPVKIRLIDRLRKSYGIYLGYFHLSFYEYLKEKSDFLENGRPDRYKSLITSMCHDFELSENQFWWRVSNIKHREEIVRLIFVLAEQSNNMEFLGEPVHSDLDVLKDLFTCSGFFAEINKIDPNLASQYLTITSMLYDAYKNRNTADSAEDIPRKFSENFPNLNRIKAYNQNFNYEINEFYDKVTQYARIRRAAEVRRRVKLKEDIEQLRATDPSEIELDESNESELDDYVADIRTKYRQKRLLGDARREYDKFIQYFTERLGTDSRLSKAQLSRLEYEHGYVDYLEGDFNSAKSFFERSSNTAAEINDWVRFEIGQVLATRMSSFLEKMCTEEIKSRFQSSLDKLLALNQQESGNELCTGWIESTRIHALEFAAISEEAKFGKAYFDMIKDTPRLQVNLKAQAKTDINKDLQRQLLSVHAMHAYLESNFEQALSMFAKYIPLGTTRFGEHFPSLVSSSPDVEYIALYYYLAARCLIALEEQEHAQMLLKLGLQLKENNANQYYQGLIKSTLDSLTLQR